MLSAVASAISDQLKSADDDGDETSDDRSAGATVGIIGTSSNAPSNCTVCAGAITQEVGESFM